MPITLSSQALRRATPACAAVIVSIALTACGASFNAQTSQPYQPAEGTNAASGPIAVRNMLVLASAEGKGELHSAIVNTGQSDDKLTAIAAPPADPVSPAPDGAAPAETRVQPTFGNVRPMTLKAGTLLTLPPATGSPITVSGAKPGEMIKVTLTFAKAAPITASVPVLTLDHYSPSPSPEASAG